MLEEVAKKIKKAAGPAKAAPALISYQKLRRSVGFLGIILPFALIIGSLSLSDCSVVQPSISHYYYTNMREIFVGTLCGVSLFLFCYKGYTKLDSWTANIAGFLALMVVLFPTDIMVNNEQYFPCQSNIATFTSFAYQDTIHLVSAALFFLTLAFISVFLFTLSKEPPSQRSLEKKIRNRIYRTCGLIMVLCIVLIGLKFWLFSQNEKQHTVLILETIALIAFGISWLTKGELIAGDK